MTLTDAAPPPPDLAPPLPGPPEITLKSSEFRKGREASWLDLETLVARIEKRGIRALSADELQRLPLLYRTALSSLSVARSIALDRHLLLYLESLALRAFLAVYGPRIGILESAKEFLRTGFPAAVRAARWHLLLAMLCLIAGSVAGFLLTMGDDSWFSALVPGGMADGRDAASTRESLLEEEIFAPWPGIAKAFIGFANFLFQHNTMVGVLTFGLGIAAGLPTLLLLIYQGLILGAFVALHEARGLTVDFLGWIAIHGVTELTAIALCGAAGFVVAEAAIFPGRYARIDSLAIAGRHAAQLMMGAVFMFFVAAILEGGFRQLVASTPGRFAVAAATALVWTLYFAAPGRRR